MTNYLSEKKYIRTFVFASITVKNFKVSVTGLQLFGFELVSLEWKWIRMSPKKLEFFVSFRGLFQKVRSDLAATFIGGVPRLKYARLLCSIWSGIRS